MSSAKVKKYTASTATKRMHVEQVYHGDETEDQDDGPDDRCLHGILFEDECEECNADVADIAGSDLGYE